MRYARTVLFLTILAAWLLPCMAALATFTVDTTVINIGNITSDLTTAMLSGNVNAKSPTSNWPTQTLTVQHENNKVIRVKAMTSTFTTPSTKPCTELQWTTSISPATDSDWHDLTTSFNDSLVWSINGNGLQNKVIRWRVKLNSAVDTVSNPGSDASTSTHAITISYQIGNS